MPLPSIAARALTAWAAATVRSCLCAFPLLLLLRWYPKKDPVEVLERDPEMIRLAQDHDVALEPVYQVSKCFIN